MKTLMTSTLLGLALLGTVSAKAEEVAPPIDNKAESIGVVSGLVIGALLGGPPGAIVTGAAGAWMGEHWQIAKNHRLLQQEMARTREQLMGLQATNAALERQQLTLQQQLADRQLLASREAPASSKTACCAQSEVVLYFRSNSTEIEPHFRTALLRFIEYSRQYPDAIVDVTGHADRRGDSTVNLLLSQHRVEQVLLALRELGLKSATYQTVAYGEQQPASDVDQQVESHFFDRRVVLKLVPPAPATLIGSRQP